MLNIAPFKDIKNNTRIVLPEYNKSWKPPKDFPNLSGAKSLAIDTETKDPELLTIGPGWGRGVGHIVGFSVATEDQGWYFPIRHTIQTEHNLNPDNALAWFKDVCNLPMPKIFANAMYDIGWLREEKINVAGQIFDVQWAEALLDDTARSYALELISKKYLGEGKLSNELYTWCARAYGGKADGTQRANIWRAPPSLVGPYAEIDAVNPFKILRKQWKLLEIAGLLDLFKLECKLANILVRVREKGIRVSEEKAVLGQQKLTKLIDVKQSKLDDLAGKKISAKSSKDLSAVYDKYKIDYPRTASDNPSFTKDWLAIQTDPLSELIFDIRRYTKARNDFLGSYLLEKATNGRVHPSFHPLRSETGGAVTGRFAASNPPIQQFPSRDQELTPIIRNCFLPEEGHDWVKADYSSIELRMFAHFSNDPALYAQYAKEPFTDFHNYVGQILGGKLPRIAVKTLNFSLLYGGGMPTVTKQMSKIFTVAERSKLITDLNYPLLTDTAAQLARIFINIYGEEFPAAQKLADQCVQEATQLGEIRTILNRRTTFNLWEPTRGKQVPLVISAALGRYGKNIKRANTHKAVNYKLQGSAADLLKLSIILAYDEGLFEHIPFHGTVHDEFMIGYNPDNIKYIKQLREIAETAIEFKVPIIMDMDYGPSWGEAKTPLELGEREWLKCQKYV